jgi:hypothetical protein
MSNPFEARPPYHFVLIAVAAIWPYANFYADNIYAGIPFVDLALYAGASVVVLVCLYLFLVTVLPRWLHGPACLALACGYVVFFFYGFIGDAFRYFQIFSIKGQFSVWILATLIVCGAALGLGRYRSVLISATVGISAMLVISVMQAASGFADVRMSRGDGIEERLNNSFNLSGNVRRSNVYSLVLDTYSRADYFLKIFNINNNPFLDALRARQFQVGARSMSNYPWTSLSMSSSLSMDYTTVGGPSQPYDSLKMAEVINGFNPVVRQFSRDGYDYVLFSSGRYETTISCSGLENVCLQCDGTLTESDILLLEKTPIAHLVRKFAVPLYMDFAGKCRISDLQKKLSVLKGKRFFLLSHHMALHDPQNVNSNCEKLDTPIPQNWLHEDHADLVRMQLECLNKEVLALVDHIVRVDPQAFILLTGDHGFWPQTDSEITESAEREMRHAVFTAMRLPAACRDSFKDDITPINHYRVIFGCLNNQTPVMLPDKYFSVEAIEPGNPRTTLRVTEWSPKNSSK